MKFTGLNYNKIVRELPEDFWQHCSRDCSVLTNSLVGASLADDTVRLWGVNLGKILFIIKGRQVNFYRSERLFLKYVKTVGERCLNYNEAVRLARQVEWYTDKLLKFVQKYRTLDDFLKRKQFFFKDYKRFFSYHFAVHWAGEYLSGLQKDDLSNLDKNQSIKRLQKGFEYNEYVVPTLEKYFINLGIADLPEHKVGLVGLKKRPPGMIAMFFDKNRRYDLEGQEVKKIESVLQKKMAQRYRVVNKLIKGLSASHGIYKGRVKLIVKFKELSKCRSGDVLVVPMTRPQYNRAISRVSAIVTDEGGILSHAAILAREIKIPCVVNTKIASKKLKSGAMVIVNGDKGWVQLI